MKGYELYRLQNAVRSLSDSGFVRVTSRGVCCEINGQNGSVSSMKVNFVEVDVHPNDWQKPDPTPVVDNHRHFIAFGYPDEYPKRIALDNIVCERFVAEVPRRMFEPLLPVIRLVEPDFAFGSLVVRVVSYIPRLLEFDEEGQPVYDKDVLGLEAYHMLDELREDWRDCRQRHYDESGWKPTVSPQFTREVWELASAYNDGRCAICGNVVDESLRCSDHLCISRDLMTGVQFDALFSGLEFDGDYAYEDEED